MFGWTLTFDAPHWLALLGCWPLLGWLAQRSLSGLGRVQRGASLLLRCAVWGLLVLALAGLQVQRTGDALTVLYLLDQSESIPRPTREAMLRYVQAEVAAHRRHAAWGQKTEDRAGIILFGREAAIEYPPLADEVRTAGVLESLFAVRTDATNIAAALKLAQASFPEDAARRVVILTDGNENLGDAQAVAARLSQEGIGIDVVAIPLRVRSEVQVEKLALPADVRRGQPVEARVVIEHRTAPDPSPEAPPVTGRLRLTRRVGDREELLAGRELPVTLRPGKNVFSFTHTLDVPGTYTYRAEFLPDDPSADTLPQNNVATAFARVRGRGRVLLIEDWENPGEFEFLRQRLGEKEIEVEVQPSNRLFTSLAELQAYDCVVLANVPRASGIGANETTHFSDEQIAMLVRNTEQFGSGLVMLGGPASFGAGGWANTELEKAMPVDFQIKNARVRAVGALVMLMHASEIPQGNYWQKVIGAEALKVLGPTDYCGCLHWDNFTSREAWLWRDPATGQGLARVEDRQRIWLGRIDQMQPGDMPAFEPAMVLALREFIPNPAAVKHMIIISDGDPSPPSASLLSQYRQNGIRISTVAVGAHGPAESKVLQDVAAATGGKYYQVTNPKALPRIFQLEARRVARPLIKEEPAGMPVVVDDPSHAMLAGVGVPRPVTGLVLTQRKDNPLVEVLLRAGGIDPENGTLLAAWRYGTGKSVAFTTDTGRRWASAWTQWEDYDKLFSQMIRYAMRPAAEQGRFTVATDLRDGRVRVVVTALDPQDEFLNFLNLHATGTDPELQTLEVPFRQEAPGRYVGEFPADKAGTYLLAIQTGQAGMPPLLTGLSVPYSPEYRMLTTNRPLLEKLAELVPPGGQPGQLVESDLSEATIPQIVARLDTFRRTLPPARSHQDRWPELLLVAACLFWADVLLRRVRLEAGWVLPLVARVVARLRGREAAPPVVERLARLRARKEEVAQVLDQQRQMARFTPTAEAAPTTLEEIATAAGPRDTPSPPEGGPSPAGLATPPEELSYTERLLAAKRRARKI